jgi:hypothetical protein
LLLVDTRERNYGDIVRAAKETSRGKGKTGEFYGGGNAS